MSTTMRLVRRTTKHNETGGRQADGDKVGREMSRRLAMVRS